MRKETSDANDAIDGGARVPRASDERATALAHALLEVASARRGSTASPGAPAPARLLAEPLAGPPADGEPTFPIAYLHTIGFLRWYDGLLSACKAAAITLAEGNLAPASPRAATDDAVLDALRCVHRMLLQHPAAAKAAYRSLVAEGRRHATTPEGAALRDRLRASRRMQRAALLWRSISLGMFAADETTELPSTYLDSLLAATERGDLEALLGRLLQRAEEPR